VKLVSRFHGNKTAQLFDTSDLFGSYAGNLVGRVIQELSLLANMLRFPNRPALGWRTDACF
jgi:hypothetical protein